MRHAVDVERRVSPELSAVMETVANELGGPAAPTLDDVRAYIEERNVAAAESAKMHPQDRTSLLNELIDLIAEYGKDALAIDFVAAKAGEDLSRTIEAAMNDPALPDNPTLGLVRGAMASGLTARLMGEGVIETDDEQTLLAEIDR